MEERNFVIFMSEGGISVAVANSTIPQNGRITVFDPCFVSFQIGRTADGSFGAGADVQPWLHSIILPENQPNSWSIPVSSIHNTASISTEFKQIYDEAVRLSHQRELMMVPQNEADAPATAPLEA